eukprot:evm.model.scf_693.6 EVM.evm.TU.scf_693.6   scf_693:43614-44972(-)
MAGDGASPEIRRRQAVVVGCGPAGALMAIFLARMGWRVAVYEKRSDYQGRVAKGGILRRAYDIILGPKGHDAIAAAGAELGPKDAVPLEGFVVHRGRVGQSVRANVKDDDRLTTVNRDRLGDALHRQGAELFPGVIEYNFEHKLVGVDFEAKVASFERVGAEGAVRRPYELLVGADGVWSGVRGEMAKAGFVTVKHKRNTGGFKVLEVDDLPGSQEGWDRCWHLWLRHSPKIGMVASPTPEGRYRVAFGTLYDDWCGSLEELKTEKGVEQIMRDKFPDLFEGREMPEGLARSLVEEEVSHNGVETDCSAFHAGDAVVLVGDAAHSVWPNAGQGCNSALESCKILAGLIEEHGGDLATALPAFTAMRKPETDAAAVMSRRAFLSPASLLRVSILNGLHRVLPFVFGESAEEWLRLGERSYAKIEARHQWQNKQLVMMVGGALGLAAFALGRRR